MLYADAVAATEAGRSVAFALMVLEAVLLERSNTDNVIAQKMKRWRIGSEGREKTVP